MMDDWQLLRRYAEEDSQESFAELVSRHVNLVYSAALRQVSDPEMARDVSQMVFTNLAARAKHLRPRGTLAGWLHRDTRFTSLELLRKERRRDAREQKAAAMQECDSDSSPDWSVIGPALDAALDQLNQTERDALLLRFFEQRSLKEVGAVLGLGEEAARKRVTRALERLRGTLARRGFVTTGAALAAALTAHAVQAAPAGLASAILFSSTAVGTAAAGGALTFKFLESLVMNKVKATLVTVVIAASVGTPLYLQRQSNQALREENQRLLSQTTQIDGLRTENNRLSNQLARVLSESPTDEQKSELLRLRGQVAQLRTEKSEMEKLRNENQRLRQAQSHPAPSTAPQAETNFPRENWTFAGYASPESAMISTLWAGMNGDTQNFLNSMTAEEQERAQKQWQGQWKDDVQAKDGLVKEFGGTKGVRVLGKEALSENEVVLSLLVEQGNGETEAPKMRVVKVGNEWKMAGPFRPPGN